MADPFIGEVRLFAGNFAPTGWAFCDGSLQAIAQIMSVKPGPSVPDATAISPVTRMNASAACAIEPSWRPPNAGMPAVASACTTG